MLFLSSTVLQPVIAPEKAGATATKAAWHPGVCNPVKNMEKHKKMTANEARDESRKVAPSMKRANPTEPTPFSTLLDARFVKFCKRKANLM